MTVTAKKPVDSIAVGIVRVSTDEQTLGPEAQRAAIAGWCATNNVELLAVYEDIGVSGAAPLEKREGLLRAIETIRERKGGILLIQKRDRLARDIVLAAMIERLVEQAGGKVVSASGEGNGDGPEAQLIRGIMDVFAQYERALIRTRTKAALAAKRLRGERVGGIPFGYSVDNGKLIKNATEQGNLDLIKQLHDKGYSIRVITKYLNENHVCARGAKWHSSSVGRILNTP